VTECFFVSDLHGRSQRYERLFEAVAREQPAAVFMGGDLLPSGLAVAFAVDFGHADFLGGFLAAHLERLKASMGPSFPRFLVILGNDDPRFEEAAVLELASRRLVEYAHDRKLEFRGHTVFGYSFVPPTPFLNKDWERYDVSRYVDPGCVAPDEGYRSVPVSDHERSYATIQQDLADLVGREALDDAIFLFHSPPYSTLLDRAALDGKQIDYVPLDVHVGSIAVKRLIEDCQPLLTLHGHVHESARLTGSWKERIGRTVALSAAHDGPELALVRFALEDPWAATRELI
jgi:uncharacterized protein